MTNKHPSEKDLRVYAGVLGLILTAFMLLSLKKGGEAHKWLSWCAYYAFFCAAAAPQLIQPVYHAWLRLASGVAAINTLLVSALIFFVFVTPYGAFRRLLGDDPLDLAYGDRDSYWHLRPGPRPNSDYERQF